MINVPSHTIDLEGDLVQAEIEVAEGNVLNAVIEAGQNVINGVPVDNELPARGSYDIRHGDSVIDARKVLIKFAKP